MSLGGKTDDLHGAPLELTAYVKALHDGRLKMLAMVKGASLHLGPMARLVVDGIDIVVASNRSQTFDIGPFLAVGIDVTTYPDRRAQVLEPLPRRLSGPRRNDRHGGPARAHHPPHRDVRPPARPGPAVADRSRAVGAGLVPARGGFVHDV